MTGKLNKVKLQINSGAEQPAKTINDWRALVQNKYTKKCEKLVAADPSADISAGNLIKLKPLNSLRTMAIKEGKRIPKINTDLVTGVLCSGIGFKGQTKFIKFTPDQLNGDIFNTGLAIKVDNKTNAWLAKNGDKIGLAPIPNVPNGYAMRKAISEQWDKFGVGTVNRVEVVPGEADADVVDTEITDNDLKELINTLEEVDPGRRIQQNPKNVPPSEPIFWRRGRQIDKGFYNAVLHMKQQMIKDKVPGAKGFNIVYGITGFF